MAALRWRGRALVAVSIAVVLAAAGAGITYSGIFAARTLVVVGAVDRSESEILATAGLAPGMNVFHLDPSEPEAALLADPWIAEATVEPELPSTVRVEIVERTPMVVGGGEVVAADGTVLPGADARGLPTVVSATGGAVDAEVRTAAAVTVASLRPAQRGLLVAVAVQADGRFELDLGGLVVRWGTPGEDRAKAAALAAVLAATADDASMPVIVDVSVPGAPAAVFG